MTLKDYQALVEAALEAYLPPCEDGMDALVVGEIPPLQLQSMRYSVMAGGKRLRPCMLLAAADMLGASVGEAMPYACALEMIHTYSLIHDDLPGMDGDTLRRGKPTNHVVYGVGQAILAGDGLLNEAMEIMADAALKQKDSARMRRGLQALQEIAFGAGARGMIAGQCADLYSERGRISSEPMLEYIYMGKTARMLTSPLRASARLAGYGDDTPEMAHLSAFGEAYGRLFQLTDDILDETGDQAALGKSVGKDRESGKLTGVALWGLDGAKARADALAQKAGEEIAYFGEKAEFFQNLLQNTVKRDR